MQCTYMYTCRVVTSSGVEWDLGKNVGVFFGCCREIREWDLLAHPVYFYHKDL